MKTVKTRFLLTTALCGLTVIGIPTISQGAITTTTTTTHSYDFPGSSPSVSSSSSISNTCPPVYSGGDRPNNGGNDRPNGGVSGRPTGGGSNGDDSDDDSSFLGYDKYGNETTYSTISDAIASGGTGEWVSQSAQYESLQGHPSEYGGNNEGGGGGGGGSEKETLCFVTTAVMRIVGEPDDGPTLTNLRRLRDNYTLHTPDGKHRVQVYYRIAPEIVRRVNTLPNAADIWTNMHDEWINPISRLIENGFWEEADKQYMQMMKIMVWQHMLLNGRPVANDVRQVISDHMGLCWA